MNQAKMATWITIIYFCTRDLHSFLSFVHCRIAYINIPLLSKVTFTPSFKPNISPLCTTPAFTSAINTILSTCLNHFTHQLPFYSRSSTHFKLCPFMKLPQNFSNTLALEHSLSFSQQLSYSMSKLWTMPLGQLLFHIDTSAHSSTICYCSRHFSALPTL